MEVLKVSAKSSPNSVAGALAGVLREKGAAEIQAIGAGAINQAIKAIAIARGFVAINAVFLPVNVLGSKNKSRPLAEFIKNLPLISNNINLSLSQGKLLQNSLM
jgi:stage V sporulation protein SpoVS